MLRMTNVASTDLTTPWHFARFTSYHRIFRQTFAMPRTRALIHFHIFKNAGTSIDASLRRCFGQRWTTFEGAHAHDLKSSAQLAQFMAANRHVRAISSHLVRPPLPTPDCLPIVFIRHPLLRAYSVYQFTRNAPSQPFSHVAKDCDFSDYIRWALDEAPGSIVIRDYQVVHLSDASWRSNHILHARAEEADLEQAAALLDHWGVAGVVEEFERSIDVYQALYKPLLPDLNLGYDRENASETRQLPEDVRLEQLRVLLGRKLHQQFMAANALDLALHSHARALLNRNYPRKSNNDVPFTSRPGPV